MSASIEAQYHEVKQQIKKQQDQEHIQQISAYASPLLLAPLDTPEARVQVMLANFDVLLGIFSFLSVVDLCVITRVCKSWHAVADDSLVSFPILPFTRSTFLISIISLHLICMQFFYLSSFVYFYLHFLLTFPFPHSLPCSFHQLISYPPLSPTSLFVIIP